ncbi:hypothetical protein KUV89_04365 [Marinobacter hydrocarbonoclasticus]|nr:hypothetical protein [Marinobacter nauticus]
MNKHEPLFRKAFSPNCASFTLTEQIVSVTQIAHKVVQLSDHLGPCPRPGDHPDTLTAWQEGRYLIRLLRQSRQIQMASTAVPELKVAIEQFQHAELTVPVEHLVYSGAPPYLTEAQDRLAALIE